VLIKDLIKKLSELDPEAQILFHDKKPIGGVCVDVEIINGFAISHPKKHDLYNTKPPLFVEDKIAKRICEDGKTFLDFRSKHIKPAFYINPVEPDFRKAYDKYQLKNQKNEQGKLLI